MTRQQQARNERQKVDTERLRSRAFTSILYNDYYILLEPFLMIFIGI